MRSTYPYTHSNSHAAPRRPAWMANPSRIPDRETDRTYARHDARAQSTGFARPQEAGTVFGLAQAVRVDLDCSLVNLTPPPESVHLVPFDDHRGRRIGACTAPGKAIAVGRWLQSFRGADVVMETRLSPRFLLARFTEPVEPWDEFIESFAAACIRIGPEGVVSIFSGRRMEEIEDLVAPLRESGKSAPLVSIREVVPADQPAGITDRQREMLVNAVALGHYEVPRKAGLRTIAERNSLSLSGASELIRRAESGIIVQAVDAWSELNWRATRDALVDVEMENRPIPPKFPSL